MKNTLGNQFTITLYGESHGTSVGCILDGVPAGLKVDEEKIRQQMEKRKPKGKISTARHETDEVIIHSGVFEGYTTGTPVMMMIMNQSQHSKDYSKTKDIARPSHADYTADVKYLGYQDYRGGGHFSGRLTTPIVAAGALCLSMLESKGIHVASHIASIGNVQDDSFSQDEALLLNEMNKVNDMYFAVLNEDKLQEMQSLIETCAMNKDSVGGTIETVVQGLPAGVGEPYFDSLESLLSHALFSIGGIKGIEFGDGFEMAKSFGSIMNDGFKMENGKVCTKTNHNGGINGGISNGMPLRIKTAIKPTPSIYQKQDTINFKTKENTTLEIEGRHDPCIVHRIRVVIDSMVAITLVDSLITRYGQTWFNGETKCVG